MLNTIGIKKNVEGIHHFKAYDIIGNQSFVESSVTGFLSRYCRSSMVGLVTMDCLGKCILLDVYRRGKNPKKIKLTVYLLKILKENFELLRVYCKHVARLWHSCPSRCGPRLTVENVVYKAFNQY